jgi:hypothetical protein
MADIQTIQRVPRGLLDLLGSKGTGDTPHLLNAALVPVIDLWWLYALENQQQLNGNTANLATGSQGFQAAATTTFTVPDGEIWLLLNHSISFGPLAAGDIIMGKPAIRRQGNNVILVAPVGCGSVVAAGANNDTPTVGWQLERPEIMKPGDQLGVMVETCTQPAAKNCKLFSSWIRLRI